MPFLSKVENLESRLLLTTFTVTNTNDEVNGPGDGMSLREAVQAADNAAGADTITFNDSLAGQTITLRGSQLQLLGEVTIIGLGANQLTINANGQSRVFFVHTDAIVDISGLNVAGGVADDGGGGIQNNGTLMMSNCIISENSASGGDFADGGGGINNRNGILTLSNITFSNNMGSSGGGIANSGMLTVTNSMFNGNSAVGIGGGIYNSGGVAHIIESTLSANIAVNGGGISNTGSMTIHHTLISGNFARGVSFNNGGGIAHFGGFLTIADCTITNNTAELGGFGFGSNSGGGVYASLGTVMLSNSLISNNSAGGGGGVFINFATLDAKDVTIISNTAGGVGGGIHNGNGIVTLENDIINENSADAGGAINNTSTLRVINSTLSGNSSNSGGGISSGGGTLTVLGSTLSGNVALIGGGGGISGSGSIRVINSTLSGNSTHFVGGGIAYASSFNGLLTVVNSTLTGNRADSDANGTGSGGGIFKSGPTTPTLNNTIITGNFKGTGNDTDDIIVQDSQLNGSNIIYETGAFTGTPYNLLNASALSIFVDLNSDNLIDASDLSNNGGPTLTHALKSDSLAADNGSDDLAVDQNGIPLTTDQRGPGFDRFVGTVDIGAFEVQPEQMASISISDVDATKPEGNAGTTAFTFTVARSNSTTGIATVDYAVGGVGVTAADFVGGILPSGTVTFQNGESEQMITIFVAGDTIVEGDESFTVTLSNISSGSEIGTGAANGTIENDDTATLTLAGVNATQNEGTGGTTTAFTFSVTLNHAVQGGFNLGYSTDDGTATLADGDYIDNDGTVNFLGNAGEVQTITILVNHDSKVEADELLSVALGAIGGLGAGIDINDITIDGTPQTGTIQNDDSATVTLVGVNASQVEGTGGTTTAFTFSVTLDNAVEGGFDLAFATNDGTATIADGDYVGNNGTLNFLGNAGENLTITVLINHDSNVEADEVFSVALGAISNLASDINAGLITTSESPQNGTILNDDAATLTLAGVNVSQNEGNGSGTTAFTFSVTLNNAVQGGFDLAYSTNDGTATAADGDYIDNDGTLTFAGNAGEMLTITVLVNRDDDIEADEQFSVALGAVSNLASGINAGNLMTAGSPQIGTILNDDTPLLSVAATDATKAEGNTNATAFTFTVTRTNNTAGETTVNYAVSGSQVTSADFAGGVLPSGTVMFQDGETEQTITILVVGDHVVEGDESFTVALSNPSPGSEIVSEADAATGTIQNDDTATLTLAGVNAMRAEGTGGTTTAFTFSVTLENAVEGGFDLTYNTNDVTATVADGDYTDNDGTLSFFGNAGEMQTITVLVNHDSKVEADEEFNIALGMLSGLQAGIDINDMTIDGSPQTGTIQNDDSATLTLAGVNATQAEGMGGTTTAFTFSVTLDNAVQGGFDLAYTTNDGTATVTDGDYVDNDGALNFLGNSGETRIITVLVNHDSKVEADEIFGVALGAISNLGAGIDFTDVTIAGSPQIGTIQNDDSATVTLAGLDAMQVEGTGGTTTAFTFSVTLDNAVQGGFDLAYTTNDGTATVVDGDYMDKDGTLNFTGNAGETKSITVLVNHDGKIEADETFTVALGAISNLGLGMDQSDLAIVGSPQTGTILNDDVALAGLSLTAADATKAEGNSGTTAYTFIVRRTNNTSGVATVDYAVSGPSVTTADFAGGVLPSGMVTFADGETEQTITVLVVADKIVEGDESFTVRLSNSSAGSEIGTAAAMGTIQNDDAATLTLANLNATQAEGTGGTISAFTFSVTLDNAVEGGFDLTYNINDGTATVADGDYIDNDGTLNFLGNAGEMQTITVLVNHDSKVEADEVFNITLGMLCRRGAGVDFNDTTIDGSPQSAMIRNDDQILVVGAGVGGGPHVRVFNVADNSEIMSFFAFDPAFSGGVRTATGDVNGDGAADIITAAGPGAGPHIRVFDGLSGAEIQSFYAFDPGFAGGVYLSVADFNADGQAEIIAAADAGGGPHVKVFDLAVSTETPFFNFFAFDAGFAGGVRVAAGDVNGDGTPDIITGAGPGATPHVRVFDGRDLSEIQSFFAFGTGFAGGIFLGSADFNQDSQADILVSAGAGGGPHVRAISGADGSELFGMFAYDAAFAGGVVVGATDVNGDGTPDLITGPGFGGGPHVRIFNGETQSEILGFFAFDPNFAGGVFVSASNIPADISALSLDTEFHPSEGAESLSLSEIRPLLAEAVARLESAEVAMPGELADVTVLIVDLIGNRLGEAIGNTVRIDINAAGFGWFIDSSPADDLEFQTANPAITGHVDLLSVLLHELGHIVGCDHQDNHDHFMAEYIELGVRRGLKETELPTLDSMFASSEFPDLLDIE